MTLEFLVLNESRLSTWKILLRFTSLATKPEKPTIFIFQLSDTLLTQLDAHTSSNVYQYNANSPGDPTPYMLPGLLRLGEAEKGDGTFTEAEEAWGEVREIMGDAPRFGPLGIDCGDINWGSMTDVSVSMVMGDGGSSLSAVEACREVIPPTLATSSTYNWRKVFKEKEYHQLALSFCSSKYLNTSTW